MTLVIALSSGDDAPPPGTTDVTGPAERVLNTVRSLDPETGEVLRSIGGIVYKGEVLRVGGFAAGEGGVWVANFANVQHVDPITETIRRTIPVDSAFLSPLVAFRTVWVATDRSVERINPATDELLRATRLTPTSGIALDPSIAAGEGNVWVALEKTLYRIDPATGEVGDEYPLEDSTAIAVGEGAVWVIGKLNGTSRRSIRRPGRPSRPPPFPATSMRWPRAVAGSGSSTRPWARSRSSTPPRSP
jgi:outer membrane protein assembly factor BamB